MLCCIFNYPPLYRESIYKKIDEYYDTQFYFGREPIEGKICGIKKLDLSIFKHHPIEIKNRLIFGRILWRTGVVLLPMKKEYSTFLITGDLSLSYIPFLILCKMCKKKVYGWGHGIKILKRKFAFFNRFFYNVLDGFFTYGEKGKQRLIDLGFPENKFHVIYNSLVDHANFSEYENLESDIYHSHFRNSYQTILFVGRLTPVKNLDWLIKVVYEHQKEGVNYNLVLIGDGTEKEHLIRLSQEWNVDGQIWFYGECYDNNQLNSLLYNADLCVSPGNVGLTAMHAMQYGVPVISHDNFEVQMPEYESIIEGETGLLYKYNDFEDMKEKIRTWLFSGKDRETIRQNCYRVINTHYNSNYQIEVLKGVIGE